MGENNTYVESKIFTKEIDHNSRLKQRPLGLMQKGQGREKNEGFEMKQCSRYTDMRGKAERQPGFRILQLREQFTGSSKR